MKTEKEIRDYMELVNRSIENLKKALRENKIPEVVYINQRINLDATLSTLRWVLGENDRYD